MSEHADDRHIVAFPFQAWGHTRPLINLATRLVRMKPCTVTLLVTDKYLERAQAEVVRNSTADGQAYDEYVRVISLGKADLQDSDRLNKSFEEAWKRLVAGEGIVCQRTNIRYAAAPKPRAIILDLFGVQAFDAVKASSENDVKTYVFNAGLTAALFHLFGSEYYGGLGDVRGRAEEEARRTGKSMSDVILREMTIPKGEVIRVPGMPPMYDYEYEPQPNGVPPQVVVGMFSRVHGLLEGCDGILLYTAESYEPAAVNAMRNWFSKTSRGVYVCGPLVPIGKQAVENETNQTADSVAIETFLDTTLESSGKQSLLYISFGSMPHNAEVDKLWTFLQVVMDLGIPFIMSHSSDDIPPNVLDKITSCTKGLVSPWTPQQTVLQHPVSYWLVPYTRGHNSVLESIIAGVPMIFWPFGADQPLCAVHVTDNLQAGYEFIECRNGAEGMKPIYRSGKTAQGTTEAFRAEAFEILRNAFGKDGEQKRGNLRRFTEAMKLEWDDGGSSKRDMLGFLDNL